MELVEHLDAIKQEVLKNFSVLTEIQLNWKDEPQRWSIAQCLDHLIVSNKQYFPVFDKILSHTYQPTFWQKFSPFTSFIGRQMIKSLGPDASRKVKGPKIFAPSNEHFLASIVYHFAQHQHDLKNYFLELLKQDASRIVISSPVTPVITYSLKDALRLIAVHEQRHINQALQLFHHANFPR